MEDVLNTVGEIWILGLYFHFKFPGHASGIVVMGENVLVLGRCRLKYLGMKNQSVSNLFWTGLVGTIYIRKANAVKCRWLGNLDEGQKGVHSTILQLFSTFKISQNKTFRENNINCCLQSKRINKPIKKEALRTMPGQ